jgi:hypothetical protein
MSAVLGMAAMALLQIWSGVHSDNAPVLTLSEARSLSPAQLSERFPELAPRAFAEAHAYSLPLFGNRLAGVELASAPRASSYPGLCEADAVGFGFISEMPAPGGPEDPPSRVTSQYSERVYKVVGDTAPRSETRTRSYRRALAELCRRSGPVLSPPERGSPAGFFVHASFDTFGFSEPVHAWFAAHALQMAVRGVQAGAVPAIDCSEDPAMPADRICADPRGLLAALSMSGLTSLGAERCERPAPGYCAVASFRLGDHPNHYLDVQITTDALEPSGPPREFSVVRVSIAGRSFVN